MITRDAIMRRARAVPLESMWYSQTTVNPATGMPADCSGWVSYCWATRRYTTATFVTAGQIREIPFSELRPGDAIGYCSPTSPGNGGHIALWLGSEGTPTQRGRHHVLDHGSGWGPKDRWVQWDGMSRGWLHPERLKAWRYVGTLDTNGETDMYCKYGDTASANVETLQLKLNRLGAGLKADGDYGPATAAALVKVGLGGAVEGKVYGPAQVDGLDWLIAAAAQTSELAKLVSDAVSAAVAQLRITIG